MPPSTRPRQPPARAGLRLIVSVVLVAAVGLAAYWNGLKAPFIWDDDPAIVSNPTIRSVLPLSESMSPPLETPAAGRPLVNLSFAINYAAGNLDETGYHAWNLAVLVASALLLFGIVRLTLAGLGPPPDAATPWRWPRRWSGSRIRCSARLSSTRPSGPSR